MPLDHGKSQNHSKLSSIMDGDTGFKIKLQKAESFDELFSVGSLQEFILEPAIENQMLGSYNSTG